jgi:hypothetical protein
VTGLFIFCVSNTKGFLLTFQDKILDTSRWIKQFTSTVWKTYVVYSLKVYFLATTFQNRFRNFLWHLLFTYCIHLCVLQHAVQSGLRLTSCSLLLYFKQMLKLRTKCRNISQCFCKIYRHHVLHLLHVRVTNKTLSRMAVKTKTKPHNKRTGITIFVNVRNHIWGLLSYKTV